MSRLRLKYVHAFVDHDGRPRYYFRRKGHRLKPLPGVPGSAEFMDAYQAALATVMPVEIGAKRTKPGSLDAALVLYYPSKEFRALAAGTQAKRRGMLERWRSKDGTKPIAQLPQQYIKHTLSTMPPHAARNWLKTVRHFAQWCVSNKLMRSDPTFGIKLKIPKKSDGHHTWVSDEIARYETHYPIGTKARLAFALGIYTLQRRGDVLAMGRQHLSDCLDNRLRKLGVRKMLSIRQQKTGTPVEIPIHPNLQAVLDATQCGDLTFVVSKKSKS